MKIEKMKKMMILLLAFLMVAAVFTPVLSGASEVLDNSQGSINCCGTIDTIEIWEDSYYQIDLENYLQPGWEHIDVNNNVNLECTWIYYDRYIDVHPVENWHGEETLNIVAWYFLCGPFPLSNECMNDYYILPCEKWPGPVFPPTYYGISIDITFNVLSVNDPPEIINVPPSITMTKESQLQNIFNVNDVFLDVDSDTVFSSYTEAGLVTSEIDQNGDVTLTSGTLCLTDYLVLEVYDGQYLNHIRVPVSVAKPSMVTLFEDDSIYLDLDSIIYGHDLISMEASEQVTLSADGNSVNVAPVSDWNGMSEIEFLLGYGTPPPPPVFPSDPIFSSKPIIGFASVSPMDFAEIYQLKYSVSVLPVNDAPVILANPPELSISIDGRMDNVLDLDDIFNDIDSNMMFSVVSNSDYVNAVLSEDNSISLTATVDDVISLPRNEVITLQAHDEQNVKNCQLDVEIRDHASVLLNEDTLDYVDLCDYLDGYGSINWAFIDLTSSDEINTDLFSTQLNIIPQANWHGVGTVDLLVGYQDISIEPYDPPILSSVEETYMTSSVMDFVKIYNQNIDVNVLAVNDPPMSVSMTSIEFDEDEALTNIIDLNDYFTDIDSFLIFDNNPTNRVDVTIVNGLVSFTPDANWFGTEVVTFICDDGQYQSQEDLLVVVQPINDPPSATSTIPSMAINEDTTTTIHLTDYFEDIDSSMNYSYIGDHHISVQIDESTGIATLIPEQNWHGQADVTFYCLDEEYRASQDFSMVVTSVNDAPSASNIPEMTLLEDQSVELLLSDYFIDIDSSIEYTYTAGENFSVDLNSTSGLINITPLSDWNGNSLIPVIASDGQYQVTRYIPINVISVNDPPAIENIVDELSFAEDAETSLNLGGMFSDVDSVLEYIVSSDKNSISVSLNELTETVTVTADENWFGTGQMHIKATDGNSIVEQDITINVTAVNDRPILLLDSSVKTIPEDSSFDISLSDIFNDIDNTLEYTIQSQGHISVNEMNSVLSVEPIDDWYGNAQITITATDGEYLVSHPITITVTSLNDPPYLTADIPPAIIEDGSEGVLVDLNSYFNDIDGDSLSFEFSSQVEVTIEATENAGVYLISSPESWQGVEVIKLTVSDGAETIEVEGFAIMKTAGVLQPVQSGITWLDGLMLTGFIIVTIGLILTALIARQRIRSLSKTYNPRTS